MSLIQEVESRRNYVIQTNWTQTIHKIWTVFRVHEISAKTGPSLRLFGDSCRCQETGLSLWKDNSNLSNSLSPSSADYHRQHVQPSSWRATADLSGCHSGLLRKGNRGYNSHRLTIMAPFRDNIASFAGNPEILECPIHEVFMNNACRCFAIHCTSFDEMNDLARHLFYFTFEAGVSLNDYDRVLVTFLWQH